MRRLSMRTIFLCTALCSAVVVIAAVAAAQPESVSAQPGPKFQLGFQALAEQIPQIVGEPLENEHPGPNDTVVQTTTTGMMLWRALDNWTGFTDGSRTWVEGPYGIEARPNEARFPWESHPPLTFDDPIAYCTAAGTVDAPDAHYTGPRLPEVVRAGLAAAFGRPGGPFLPPAAGVFLRCYQGQLLACSVGANLNCGKADTSTTPNQGMVQYCQANPESDFIPLYIAGHEGIYNWQCRAGKPEIQKQMLHVDPRGFVEEFWYPIQPLGTSPPK